MAAKFAIENEVPKQGSVVTLKVMPRRNLWLKIKRFIRTLGCEPLVRDGYKVLNVNFYIRIMEI